MVKPTSVLTLSLLALPVLGSAQFWSLPAVTDPPQSEIGQPDDSHPDYVPNQVIVKYKDILPGLTLTTPRRVGLEVVETIHTAAMRASGYSPVYVLKVGSVPDAVRTLRTDPRIEYAEPNWIYRVDYSSDDPLYTGGSLWGMYGSQTTPANQFGSQAGRAWSLGNIGTRSVVVGVVDEGIDTAHPDLNANIWVNPHDPVDGIDNDGNGYIDDVHGWDFAHNDQSVYDGRWFGFGRGTGGAVDRHGTHVAGTIGAVGGNGRGVAGVAWNVTMISVKFLGIGGGSLSNGIKSIDYLTDLKTRHGMNIVASNNSWGGGGFSQALLDAITRGANQGILFVAAAGNGGSDGVGDDNDASPFYPASYNTTAGAGYDAVIAVASITSTGARSGFSNFGATTVDLGAPGSGINSTLPKDTYGSFSGTSMATPHVTGGIVLYRSANPNASANQTRQAIFDATIPTSSMNGRTVTGGRLNVANF
jgi:subtilisin family serine protease